MPGTDWPGVAIRWTCCGRRLGDLHRRTPPGGGQPHTWLVQPHERARGLVDPHTGGPIPGGTAWVDRHSDEPGSASRKYRFQCPVCGSDTPLSERRADWFLDRLAQAAAASAAPAVLELDVREISDTPRQ